MEFIIKMFTDTSCIYFWIYWVSMSLALAGAIPSWVSCYKNDTIRCYEDSYKPSLTVGAILINLMVSIIPIINSIVSIGTILDFCDYSFNKLEKLFAYGIVSKKYRTKIL